MTTSIRNDQQVAPVYQATIVDQLVVTTGFGDTRIILAVRLTAQLKNPANLDDGVESIQPLEREVWMTIPSGDDSRLRWIVRDLDRLGFSGDDISRLHPDHPDNIRLVNRVVHVRSRFDGEHEYWNLAWPTAKPRPVDIAELRQAAEPLQTRIAAARQPAQGPAHQSRKVS